jgi:glycosyltransferase involved in cell wall biosynthesis
MAGPGVELPGWVTEAEKHRLLGSAWLLVHPAAVEGWGLVVMEAAARETPTLGFDVPGVRDSVVDGRSGVLARSDDGLVGAWTQLAADGPGRHAMGRWARARARQFSWSSTVDRFLEVAAEARAWGGAAAPGIPSGSQVGPQLVP